MLNLLTVPEALYQAYHFRGNSRKYKTDCIAVTSEGEIWATDGAILYSGKPDDSRFFKICFNRWGYSSEKHGNKKVLMFKPVPLGKGGSPYKPKKRKGNDYSKEYEFHPFGPDVYSDMTKISEYNFGQDIRGFTALNTVFRLKQGGKFPPIDDLINYTENKREEAYEISTSLWKYSREFLQSKAKLQRQNLGARVFEQRSDEVFVNYLIAHKGSGILYGESFHLQEGRRTPDRFLLNLNEAPEGRNDFLETIIPSETEEEWGLFDLNKIPLCFSPETLSLVKTKKGTQPEEKMAYLSKDYGREKAILMPFRDKEWENRGLSYTVFRVLEGTRYDIYDFQYLEDALEEKRLQYSRWKVGEVKIETYYRYG